MSSPKGHRNSPPSNADPSSAHPCETLIIGSGFGGAMAAQALVDAGREVVMVERGDWVERGPVAWRPESSYELTRHYSRESPYHVIAGGYGKVMGATYCVGGPSVFYGCVSFRFRERDFQPIPEIVGASGARWPIGYADLEPHYQRAEEILRVSGDDTGDPTRPSRRRGFPQPPPPLAAISTRIGDAARALGLSPFPLPLAISYAGASVRGACEACRTCDTFACAVEAKNDIATAVIKPLLARGLTLHVNTTAVQLHAKRGRIVAVDCSDRATGGIRRFCPERVVLSAGTLASPHLLLSSELDRANPAGHLIGRNLMRHCNALIFGLFPRVPDQENRFHKQLAIHDFYFGDAKARSPMEKLGGIQQVMTPPVELVKAHLPWGLRSIVPPFVEHMTGLLVIAEDQPHIQNGVRVDLRQRDDAGLARIAVEHRYSKRDVTARRQLARRARKILRKTGAWLSVAHAIKTFSHAVGTVRFGDDPETAPLDAACRFRGVDNLYVVDGSFMPTSAAANPSLTIAANGLRVGAILADSTRA